MSLPVIDITNQTFGQWTVLYRASGYIGRGAFWICKCICGTIKPVNGQHLRKGRSTKCRQCVRGKSRDNIPISSRQWESIKRGAQKRNIIFDLTRKDAYQIFIDQNNRCALTGIILQFSKNHESRARGNASLDRIDSTQGYTVDNVQWVLKIINKMKGSLSMDQLYYYCRLIFINEEKTIGQKVKRKRVI